MTRSWLSVHLSVATSVSRVVQKAAESADLVDRLIDGQQWLTSAPFSSVEFGINFDRYPRGASVGTRLRRDVLEVELEVDPATLPDLDENGYRWHFVEAVLGILRQVGEQYRIGLPPLRIDESPSEEHNWPSDEVESDQPLLPGNELRGVWAELSALEADEVLVVTRLPGDDPRKQQEWILAIDSKLSSTLGDIRGSSSAGDYYVFAVGIDPPSGT